MIVSRKFFEYSRHVTECRAPHHYLLFIVRTDLRVREFCHCCILRIWCDNWSSIKSCLPHNKVLPFFMLASFSSTVWCSVSHLCVRMSFFLVLLGQNDWINLNIKSKHYLYLLNVLIMFHCYFKLLPCDWFYHCIMSLKIAIERDFHCSNCCLVIYICISLECFYL